MIEKLIDNNHILCEYGCNKLAQYKLNNGKYCCSESTNSCSAVKKKNGTIKLVDKICPHCQQEFKQINIRTFANHVRWCPKNPKHEECCGQKFKDKMLNTVKDNFIFKHGELKTFEVECHLCKTKFNIQEYENDFPTKERYFCSIKCAHSYSGKQANPQNISKGVKKYCQEHLILLTQKEIRKCIWCDEEFETTNKINAQYCSYKCSSKHRAFKKYEEKLNAAPNEYERIKIKFRKYRIEASFNFSLKQFPDEFDFSLIEKYGWYKAKNHGNNLNGVSRDHMYSVKDGFLNNIDPKILAHPANCQLIRHNDNVSKGSSSCITIEELMKKIEIWNKKYGII